MQAEFSINTQDAEVVEFLVPHLTRKATGQLIPDGNDGGLIMAAGVIATPLAGFLHLTCEACMVDVGAPAGPAPDATGLLVPSLQIKIESVTETKSQIATLAVNLGVPS